MISVRHKIWLGFGGLLLILLMVAAISVRVLTRYSRVLDQAFHDNYDSAVFCDAMKDSLDELNNRAQQAIWQQSPGSPDSGIIAQEGRFETSLQRQLGNCTLPGERQLTEQLGDLWSQCKLRYDRF